MIRRLAVFAAIPIILLAMAPTAMAAGPVITTSPFGVTAMPWGPTCGPEPIMATFAVTRRTETFFDGDVPVLLRRHVSGAGTLWLDSTGTTFAFGIDFNATTDLAARTTTITGQWAHVLVPGSGIVFANSGRVIQDVSQFPPIVIDEAGVHQYVDPGATARLCAALGAP